MGMQNQRKVYGETMVRLGAARQDLVMLEADLGKSTMSALFETAYPDRHFEMGIAEADMVSFAAGLALAGKQPFTNTFAVFASGRPYDQIRTSVCTARLNVRIVGSSAGLSDFGDGATHQAIDDIAIMRVLPNMTVLCPADGIEMERLIETIVDYVGPVYIRSCRNDVPDILPADYRFEIGKPYVVREGSDITVFAVGAMVAIALRAADMLAAEGISLRIVNVSTLKPFNDARIVELVQGMKGVVTAEEHSMIGGLASAVAYALRGVGIPNETVAIADMFGQSAHTYDELLAFYGLTDKNIADKARGIMAKA